jgi:putative ABC transport system permease protein
MMRLADTLAFATRALAGHRVRTSLMLLAMAIGVAAVVVLTALSDGARRYVTGEFAALGTHLLIVLPGRKETTGGIPPITGETSRDLTIDDALALYRSRAVARVAPMNVGEAPVSRGSRERDAVVLGTTAEFLEVRRLDLAGGRFLPEGGARQARPVCVIGRTVRDALFGGDDALGEWVRVGDRRFRVIGVVAQKGRSIGVDLDEMVIIPVASAQALFDTPSLFRILVEAKSRDAVGRAKSDIRRIISARHEGEEDVTVITQDSVLSAFDRIFKALTLTVAGIAAISLLVAGILVMNVMLVSVSQRTAEIGLLKALGAPALRIQTLFLVEAAQLSLLGAIIGVAVGLGLSWAVGRMFPALPSTPPLWAIGAAVSVALVTGVAFAVLPARRAARVDPVQSLAGR